MTSSAAPRKRPRGPRLDVARRGVSGACDDAPWARGRSASPVPAYHAQPVRLRAEIDRGDVWTSYPFDAEGRPRPSPSRTGQPLRFSSRPTPARSRSSAGRRQSARGNRRRSTTTPRPFATRRRPSDDGTGAISSRRRHGSLRPPPPTGSSCGEDRTGGGCRMKSESARVPISVRAGGFVPPPGDRDQRRRIEYADIDIRTHGSANYRSILRGSSHGCHRLFNHLAIRLGVRPRHAEHTVRD